jgi:hypothetical protein
MNLPSQTGVRFLNNLPEDIRLEGNLRKFRNRLTRFLILEEFHDVGESVDRTWYVDCAPKGVAERSFISLSSVRNKHELCFVFGLCIMTSDTLLYYCILR